MDGIVMLREDHKTVEKLFKRFEKTGDEDVEERREIVDEVIGELTVHAWIEEQVFYPAAREAAPDTTDHVLESVEEHHAVVWMLSELKDMDAADERFKAKMTVLMENVRHHVEEEEDDWFPEVRKAMGRNRLVELGERMEEAKGEAPRDPLQIPSARDDVVGDDGTMRDEASARDEDSEGQDESEDLEELPAARAA
ncbi:hemerythrin domain-containing protein [Streptomyces sp. NPDC101118]|uniref:hemerythrin domain-containing protein n=1 Tax=Streptomyces sp. NPDC101118 TaxID=3366109 RepID=UPI0038209706